ncbi:MAG: helix-turn-helix domain-containing protein [Clostridium sp.]|nr:helix-turn-helix domain-containing protein [Clostridium sp.]MCM1459163.1 helix-turn-helix domain-containing protein [Bacteroides sp.]
MNIGEVIRENRKKINMTQEEMANRLGVTAPAVNKWENGNSMPDIMLLAPIARLLGITLDTLLSYREALTDEEIKAFIVEEDERFGYEEYDTVFAWVKETLEQYPNCEELILQMAAVLDAQRIIKEIPNEDAYDGYIYDCYNRCLKSGNERTRQRAADALYGLYLRKEQYDKAEDMLAYIPEQNPERKRKLAQLYERKGNIQEAYKTYEELLFAEYQMTSAVFHGMYMLALKDKDMEKAHIYVQKQEELARLFEMGKYYEVSCRLELATMEQDADAVIDIMGQMLNSISDIRQFTTAKLYGHMTFQEVREEFLQELKNNLLACFCDEESYGFLKEDERYQELVKGYMEKKNEM